MKTIDIDDDDGLPYGIDMGDKTEKLEAVLNIAVNGLDVIINGHDYAGIEIHRATYATGLREHITELWEEALKD